MSGEREKTKSTAESGGQKAVLSDHKRVGKKFISPMAQLGIRDVHWLDTIIPELIWLALLNSELGIRRGAQLTATVSKLANELSRKRKTPWFATVRCFESLTHRQQLRMVDSLDANGELSDLRKAVSPLLTLYPECPLRFLIGVDSGELDCGRDSNLTTIKTTLEELFDRHHAPATWCQANAIYAAFVTGKLKVANGLALAEFPAIEDFPRTEKSRLIASGVRATVTGFFGHLLAEENPWWPRYFWNRGLELEDCELEHVE